MKKKSVGITFMTIALSTVCFASFTSCFGIFTPSEVLAEELIDALQNKQDVVAVANELQFGLSLTKGTQSQTMELCLSSVENVESMEADLFLEGLATNGTRTETMMEDIFVRDGAVLSTGTYEDKADKNTQELTVIDSVEEVLDEAMGGLLGVDIPLEGDGSEAMRSLIYFAGEYDGVRKDWDVYTLDFNETLYNVVKSLFPTIVGLDDKTTVGQLLEEKEVKRLIDTSFKDITAKEFHDGLSSLSGTLGFFAPLKTEDASKSVYEYLLILTKTQGFLTEVTEGDALLYDTALDDIFQLFDSSVEEFVEEFTSVTDSFIKNGVGEDGIVISIGDAESKVGIALTNFMMTYRVSGGKVVAQEVDVDMTFTTVDQTVGIELSVSSETFNRAQTLTDLSERTVSVSEYTFSDGLHHTGFSRYVTPHVKKDFMVIMKDGEIAQVALADGYYEERTYMEYDAATGMYAYTCEGTKMLAKVVPNAENNKIEIEIYYKGRPKELFNYLYIYEDGKEVKKGIPFEEFELLNKQSTSTAVVDGLRLKLNADGESYAVTGFSGEGKAVVNIPEVYNGKPITVIGNSAFYKNETIEEVTVPSTVKTVQSYAFNRCSNLKKATVHATVIEDEAFAYCVALESVSLSKATRIGKEAFRNCQALKDVTLSENLYIVEDEAFYYCQNAEITLPKSLTIIEESAFAYCEKIEAFDCPNVIKLGESAFFACKNIASITIPSAITVIGDSVFSGCEALTKLNLGNKVTRIGDFAFSGCTNLENLTIPTSVTGLGRAAFSKCGIKALYLPDSVQSLSYEVFNNCANLESVRLPNGITFLDAFANCDKLTSIELPSSLKTLGSSSFTDCDGLVSIVIPEGVTKLDSGAFNNCDNLESVTLPESLRSIDVSAFGYCPKLKTLTFSVNMSYIGSIAFAYSGIETIVYKGTMEQWKNIRRGDHWNEYMGDVVIQCTDGKLNKNDEEIA